MSNNRSSYLIGITGTIGSGKSSIGKILESLNVPVIDTDKVVHELFRNDDNLKEALIKRFGESISTINGNQREINRSALAALVFKDESARKDLERIVHPATISECNNRIEKLANHPVIAILVPLLFEAGLQSEYDEIWCIKTEESRLKERIANRDKLNEEEIEMRLAAQLHQDEKARLSHRVIDNSGTLLDTEKEVRALIETVLAK